jgi:hypothetical protein
MVMFHVEHVACGGASAERRMSATDKSVKEKTCRALSDQLCFAAISYRPDK